MPLTGAKQTDSIGDAIYDISAFWLRQMIFLWTQKLILLLYDIAGPL